MDEEGRKMTDQEFNDLISEVKKKREEFKKRNDLLRQIEDLLVEEITKSIDAEILKNVMEMRNGEDLDGSDLIPFN